jgi:GMP synthase (glutamine-hydrolysing)
MMLATAIRFVHFEDLGSFEADLGRRGYTVRYAGATVDEINNLNPLVPHLLICLGGPIGAYEDGIYPVLKPIMKALERRIAADLPTMGICLGAQIIARVLGARVYPGGRKEIGWSPLRLTESGRRGFLRHLGAEHARVLHWHGDTFDLPTRATLLASTDMYPNQAFAFGSSVLGLQFHAEATASGLERWYIGHACEISSTPGVEVAALRADTERFAPALRASAARFFEEWLSQTGAEEGGGRIEINQIAPGVNSTS